MEITIDLIKKETEEFFKMKPGTIDKKTRKREIVQARQIAMKLSKELTKSSLATIGAQIGRKDHATVLHASKTVNNLLDTDKQYKADYEDLLKILNGNYYSSFERMNELMRMTKNELSSIVLQLESENTSLKSMFTRLKNKSNRIKRQSIFKRRKGNGKL